MEKNINSVISVIIPVFNGENYLTEAIESVLNQTYQALELIIIDDGSTDGTSQIVGEYNEQIIYVLKEHSGIGDTLNRGISKAQGKYIAFLDADDLWVENKLDLQIASINKSDVDMIFGYIQQFISPELNEKEKLRIYCPDGAIPGYSRDTILIKKKTFIQVGLFSANYRVGEFIDWYMRAQNIGLKSFMLANIVAKRRLHQTNIMRQDYQMKIDYVRILKAGLDRRRNSGM